MGSIAGYMERAIDKLVELGTVPVCFAPTERTFPPGPSNVRKVEIFLHSKYLKTPKFKA